MTRRRTLALPRVHCSLRHCTDAAACRTHCSLFHGTVGAACRSAPLRFAAPNSLVPLYASCLHVFPEPKHSLAACGHFLPLIRAFRAGSCGTLCARCPRCFWMLWCCVLLVLDLCQTVQSSVLSYWTLFVPDCAVQCAQVLDAFASD